MKNSGNSENIISLIKQKRTITRFISWFFSVVLLHMLFACSYFKVQQIEAATEAEKQAQINNFEQEQKYIVIHSQEVKYHLEKIDVNQDDQLLSGTLVPLNANHMHPKDPNIKIGKTYRYNKNKTEPLNEVHIYLNGNYDLEQGKEISIPISEVERIAVIDKNVGRTIINIVGSTLGVLALATIIVALTKSSCPFIYSYDGENYVFNGELYPGNIIRDAQINDYLKLNDLCENDGFYKIRISNELLEVQHTDLVELILIDLPQGSEVLVDPAGNPLVIQHPKSPIKAISNGRSVLQQIKLYDDESEFTFNSLSDKENDLSSMKLIFQKPDQTESINLKLTVKNSMWLDYIFGKFNEKFGSYYPTFQKQQQNFTVEKSISWQDSQHIPLFIYVKRNGNWILEEKIYSTGPLAFRDIGLKINISDIETDHIEIKLETGFMFWEVDYASISEGINSEIKSRSISAFRAVSEKGTEVSRLLQKSDDQYLTQEKPGEFVDVFYEAPEISKGNQRSIFIKSKGYYNYTRNYEGTPDLRELLKFKQAGYFTKFSKTSYDQIFNTWELEKTSDYAL